jgi:uncharacterized protein YdaU (DUF1376 family)
MSTGPAKVLPMMPLFVSDWIAGTRHLSLSERGSLLDLLCWQWANGPLPSDEQRLARLLGCSKEEFRKMWAVISSEFKEREGGLLNTRLEDHRAKALERLEKRRESGKLGGQKTAARKRAGLRASSDTARAEASAEANAEASAEAQAAASMHHLSLSPSLPSAAHSAVDESNRESKSLIWTMGVSMLTNAGRGERSARSFLGRLRSEYGDQHVAEAVAAAASASASEPAAFITGALRARDRRANDDMRFHVPDEEETP